MSMYERLYDESENVNVKFIGMTTDKSRYDFGIMYSSLFFGKPLVICMQTGQSFLMCDKDANDVDYLQKVLKLDDVGEAKIISEFLTVTLPSMSFEVQYMD